MRFVSDLDPSGSGPYYREEASQKSRRTTWTECIVELWVNLPSANKRDNPLYQSASAASLPKFQWKGACDVKLLVGDFDGKKSPVICQNSEINYMDFDNMSHCGQAELPPIPLSTSLQTRILFVYKGTCDLGQGHSNVKRGEVFLLSKDGDSLEVKRASEDLGFLLIQGKRIGEPCVQYGPFVMSTKDEVQQAFMDFQNGGLTNKPATFKKF